MGKQSSASTHVSYIRANNIAGVTDYLRRQTYDINEKDDSNHGFTPLMVASARGFTEIARLLLENGADIAAQSQRGWTALMVAARQGHAETVMNLAGFLLDLNDEDFDERTALFHAIIGTHTRCATVLLARGADPNWQAHDGSTPIIFAASKGDVSLIELLLDYGADRYLTMDDGRGAITIAETRGHKEAANRLHRIYRNSLSFDDVRSYSRNAEMHRRDWKRNWPHHCTKCFGNGMDGEEVCTCLAKGFCPCCDDSGWRYGTALPLSIPCRHCGWLFDNQIPPTPRFVLISDGMFIDNSGEPNARDVYKLERWQKFSDTDDKIEWATPERPTFNSQNIVRPTERPKYKCKECKCVGYDFPHVLKECEDCHTMVAVGAIEAIDYLYCNNCGGFPETICAEVCGECYARLSIPESSME